MDTSANREELIERYLAGELQEEELREFENEMNSNADFKEEVMFQQDVVKVLAENRKMELKTRLNNIEVGGGISSASYIAAGVSSIVVVALIAFFSGIFDFKDTQVQKTDDSEITEEIIEETTPLAEVEEPNTVIETLDNSSEQGNVIIEEVAVISDNEVSENEEIPEADNTESQTPQFNRPAIPESGEADEIVASETGDSNTNELSGSKREVSKVEVEIQSSGQYDFHYKYFNNKLFLYGDFSSSPYELIELNTEKSRDLYMFYRGRYYALQSNQLEVTRLTPLRDKIIIRGLDNLR